MEREQLKRVLAEQRENLLSRKLGVPREALGIVEKKLKLPHVVMITGIRRSGKSTLLRQIIDRFYGEDFYYIDFEDERLFGFDPKDFNLIYEALLDLYGEKKTFFIDEIQRVDGFETFVRRFYADGFKFFITGSNTGLLSWEFGTKLTGRHVDIAVRPFSFREFLVLRGEGPSKKGLYTTLGRARLKKLFDEYLRGGGMPEYATSGDIEVLTRVYEDIVVKDIIARYDIQNERQLRELYRYMITNFSKPFSFNSLRKAVGLGSVETVGRYASHLEETHLGRLVSKFDYSLKKQIINDKKLYVVDNGLISVVSTKIGEGPGWFLENLVYNELAPAGEIFYYSGTGECDFVVADRGSAKTAVQVCYELTAENRDREVKGLLEAMGELNIDNGMILTYDQEETLKESGKTITVKPVWKWLLE